MNEEDAAPDFGPVDGFLTDFERSDTMNNSNLRHS